MRTKSSIEDLFARTAFNDPVFLIRLSIEKTQFVSLSLIEQIVTICCRLSYFHLHPIEHRFGALQGSQVVFTM